MVKNRDRRAEADNHALDAADVRPFSNRGFYQTVYDVIFELPFYRRAMELHMQWIRSIETPRPVIIDAGGGSGIMTAEAMRVRHDAVVYLFDVNPAMAEQARKRGVPNNRIIIADVTDMSMDRSVASEACQDSVLCESATESHRLRIKSVGVDHVFSHSVVWALARPEAFYAEAQRVLKQGGTLAVSTVGENMRPYRQYFLDYLEQHLSAAVQRGTVSPAQKETFLQQNESLYRGG